MASVYGGAVVTIAASDAADSSRGFLHDYKFKFEPCELLYSGDTEDATLEVFVIYLPGDMRTVAFEPPSLLSKRGWALEERLLSPRTLSFRNYRLHWECAKSCCSDSMHYPYRTDRNLLDKLQRRPIYGIGRPSTSYEYWCDIITIYSDCRLSI